MMRWRHLASVALVMGALLLAAAAPAAAQADPSVSVDVTVDGDEMTLALSDIETTVGALELEIEGLPPIDDTCTLIEGIGACNTVDDVTTIVALNPTGWTGDAQLMTVDLERSVPADDLTVRLVRVTDVEGIDIVGVVGSEAGAIGSSEDDGSSILWPLLIGLGAIVTLGVGFGVLRSRNVADPVD